MAMWATEELSHVDLGDKRRNERLICILEDLVARPSCSPPEASRDNAALQGMYDFWASPRVSSEAIIDAHRQKTLDRIDQDESGVILAIQDTTEFNFTHHPSTEGVGHLDSAKSRGLKCHSVLCANGEGTPLGVINQQIWARDPATLGKKHERHQKPTAEKESQKWLEGSIVSQQHLDQRCNWVMVGDRESDIFDLFAFAQQQEMSFLVRAAQDRVVSAPAADETTHLQSAIRQVELSGSITVEVSRHPGRKARSAQLSIRFATLELHPPQSRPKSEGLQPIAVQVILAEELNPPKGEKPISWLLLTTLAVNTLADATQCLKWYSYRWLIERYHFVLKSGCCIEKLQLKKAERIERAIATYTIVAWRLLWLSYEARHNPQMPCNEVLEDYEWEALYVKIHQTTDLPESPPSLQQAVHWIATLGGFIGRKRDGPPGVQTLWRGLKRLSDIAQTWKFSNPERYSFVK